MERITYSPYVSFMVGKKAKIDHTKNQNTDSLLITNNLYTGLMITYRDITLCT